jgi:hypothetical protein
LIASRIALGVALAASGAASVAWYKSGWSLDPAAFLGNYAEIKVQEQLYDMFSPSAYAASGVATLFGLTGLTFNTRRLGSTVFNQLNTIAAMGSAAIGVLTMFYYYDQFGGFDGPTTRSIVVDPTIGPMLRANSVVAGSLAVSAQLAVYNTLRAISPALWDNVADDAGPSEKSFGGSITQEARDTITQLRDDMNALLRRAEEATTAAEVKVILATARETNRQLSAAGLRAKATSTRDLQLINQCAERATDVVVSMRARIRELERAEEVAALPARNEARVEWTKQLVETLRETLAPPVPPRTYLVDDEEDRLTIQQTITTIVRKLASLEEFQEDQALFNVVSEDIEKHRRVAVGVLSDLVDQATLDRLQSFSE